MYISQITAIGPLAAEMAEQQMMVLFGDDAPEAVAEIAVMHSGQTLERDIASGDEMIVGEQVFTVTAVGSEANRTFRAMGHCTLVFTGANEVALPGQIALGGGKAPVVRAGEDLMVVFA